MYRTFKKIFLAIPRQQRPRAIGVLCAMMLSSLVQVAGIVSVMPFLVVLADPGLIAQNMYLQRVYSTFNFASPQQFMATLGATTFIMLLASTALHSLAFFMQTRFVHQQRLDLSARLMNGLLAKPYPFFVQRNHAELAKALTQDTTQFVNSALIPAAAVVNNTLQLITLIALILLLNPIVAFAMIAALGGAYAVVYRLTRPALLRSGEARNAAELEANRAVWESLSGIKAIKLSGREEVFLRRFQDQSQTVSGSLTTLALLQSLPRYVIEVVALGCIVLFALLLTLQDDMGEGANSGIFPVLAVYAFAGYRMMPALQQIYNGIANIRHSSLNIERVTSYLADWSGPSIVLPHENPLSVGQQIEFDRVSYHHGSDGRHVVEGIALSLPVGSSLGLIGRSGAGKSTLLDLFLGLLVPDSGRLLVDGTEITKPNRRAWQQNLGYVPQDIYLTGRSVAENIAFGVEVSEIDMAKVKTCAQIAQLHDVVELELPDGYATLIGDRGLRLSGGQRQRLGIARALYNEPAVLVLDEATNALDPVTEALVLGALDRHYGSRTRILVAHRMSTVVSCDQIAILERGRLVDIGSYEQLYERSRVFRELVNADTSTTQIAEEE